MIRLPRPPLWALLTLTALVVGNAGLFTFLALRPAPTDPNAGRPSVAASTSILTPPATASAPTTSAAPTTQAEPPSSPLIAVYGDGYTSGSAVGGMGAAGWPALLAEQLDAELQLEAVSMTGYEAVGVTGQNFAGLVSAAPSPDATVTVVFGSRNDLNEPAAAVGVAAAETFTLVRSNAPDTRIVVVGPTWSNADVPAELVAQRDEIEVAAQAVGATFVDPIAQGWFRQPDALIADDGISPTDAGHRFMADALAPVVERVLGRR